MVSRSSVVTGSASGIGAATRRRLEDRGELVIGIDLHDSDLALDLTTTGGRSELVDRVAELSGGRIDTVYAVAGIASPSPATVALNYFGAVATLQGLRPLLAESTAPRAVVVSSFAAIHPADDALMDALRTGDEPAALALAAEIADDPDRGNLIYPSSKKALSQWVRRNAPSAQWAGAGIPLNAVAPGTTATAMTAPFLATEEGKTALLEITPMPLNGIADPDVVARLMAWLGSDENTHLCGQIIFVDGGSDAVVRGESAW
jgi:NAD(P)-dependent dehydrogenase (short-subunit alcohol dehydrogenase family)